MLARHIKTNPTPFSSFCVLSSYRYTTNLNFHVIPSLFSETIAEFLPADLSPITADSVPPVPRNYRP